MRQKFLELLDTEFVNFSFAVALNLKFDSQSFYY